MSTTAAITSTTAGTRTGTTVHPQYAQWAPIWKKLLHIYEGSGGFLDGTYLVAHPREWKDHDKADPVTPTKKLVARRKLARYENVAATLLDQKRSAIFRETIVRTVGEAKKETPHPLELWWQNVDGNGTNITDYMSQAFLPSALFGHVVHYMDRPMEAPLPKGRVKTKADEKAPYLRVYSPLDVLDWLVNDRGQLVAVKFQEAVQRASLLDKAPSATDVIERIVDGTTWKIIGPDGKQKTGAMGQGDHRFGRLPVVIHYAKRRALTPFVGASVLGDPALYIDCYNLTSEIRQLLRDQTFGWLNVELGTGPEKASVVEAQQMMGQDAGTDNVIFTPGPANFIQPDTSNVEVYQEERKELLRTIYRLAAIPWEADSRDAEAVGSLKLKREDMNQVLANYADECEKAEQEITELWFRATHGDSWEAAMKDAGVVIRYPDNFDVTPFSDILEQAQAAVSLNMGAKFMTELRRRLVAKFLPDATPDVVAEIDKELEEIGKQEQESGAALAGGRVKELIDRLRKTVKSGEPNPDDAGEGEGAVAA